MECLLSSLFQSQEKLYLAIFFDKINTDSLPFWFIHWWDEFGTDKIILYPSILKGYNTFLLKYQSSEHEKHFKKSMFYFIYIGVWWVLQWFYDYNKNPVNAIAEPVFSLTKKYRIKWWNGFKAWNKLEESTIINWIN